jgi:hypothetical protein
LALGEAGDHCGAALSGSGGRTRPGIFARKCFGSAMCRRIAFNRGANPESGARTRTHSEGPQLPDKKEGLSTLQSITRGLPKPRLKKSKNEIDTLSRILVKRQSTSRTEGN